MTYTQIYPQIEFYKILFMFNHMPIYYFIIYFYYVYDIINCDSKKNYLIIKLLNIIHINKSLDTTSFKNLVYSLNINISK